MVKKFHYFVDNQKSNDRTFRTHHNKVSVRSEWRDMKNEFLLLDLMILVLDSLQFRVRRKLYYK
jgi:hypothetical protein